MFIPPTTMTIFLVVSSFVVLLDNHTTARKGWKWDKLHNEWKEYYDLIISATGYDPRIAPFSFLYSGYIGIGSLDYVGAVSYYQSTTTYSTIRAYVLHLNSVYLSPYLNDTRSYGYSIRCLAR